MESFDWLKVRMPAVSWEMRTAANRKNVYVSPYQDAMRVTVMIDDAENMASSITPTQWEGSCFSLKSFDLFLYL